MRADAIVNPGAWLHSPTSTPTLCVGGTAASAGEEPSLPAGHPEASLRVPDSSESTQSALCPPPQHAQPFESGKCTSGSNNQLLGSVLRWLKKNFFYNFFFLSKFFGSFLLSASVFSVTVKVFTVV